MHGQKNIDLIEVNILHKAFVRTFEVTCDMIKVVIICNYAVSSWEYALLGYYNYIIIIIVLDTWKWDR